jgi:hypothetical protein
VALKYLLAFGLIALLNATAQAQTYQQTCQYIANIRYCNTVSSPDLVGTMANAAQADQARAQADLAREQAAALGQQREEQEEGRLHTTDPYKYCISHSPAARTADEAVAISSRCEREIATAKTQQPSLDKLRASAATSEAILRNAPPDSEAFRNAAQSLRATNEELAKRGALK